MRDLQRLLDGLDLAPVMRRRFGAAVAVCAKVSRNMLGLRCSALPPRPRSTLMKPSASASRIAGATDLMVDAVFDEVQLRDG